MTLWMLDTNIASHVIKGDRPEIADRLASLPMTDIVVSSVTEGELFYGLAKRDYPKALSERVRQFLLRVDVLPWDHDITRTYGDLRASCEAKGVTLAPLYMMIAAHAKAADAILVTRDRAFAHVLDSSKIDDWTKT
jgi:tRNA(fMet)-specific endonuclease VapC